MDRNCVTADESIKYKKRFACFALLLLAFAAIPGCRSNRWSASGLGVTPIRSVNLHRSPTLVRTDPQIESGIPSEQGGIVLASANVVAVPIDPVELADNTRENTATVLSNNFNNEKDRNVDAELIHAGDPSPPEDSFSAQKLTFDEVINTTLVNDPVLRGGLEYINQANADALTASLKPNPGLGISQTLMPLTRPFTVDRQGGPPQFDVGINYPIDWYVFGKQAAAMQTAANGVRVSQSKYADQIRLRVLEASLAFYDVQEAKGLVEVARQDRDNLKNIEDLTAKAVELGGRGSLELDRIRLDRLRADQELRIAENTLTAAKASLRSLMGFADRDLSFDVADAVDDASRIEPLPHEEAFAIAEQQRPDLRALRWKVAMANSNRMLQYRKAFPEVAPQIGYTKQFQQKAIGFPDANSFGFGMQMSLPIHNRNQGNRRRASSEYVQSTFESYAGSVTLRSELIQAESELKYLAENIGVIQKEQIQVAEKVRGAINAAYAAGGRPLIDVLDAQRSYRETYRRFIVTRAAYSRAVERYSAILGKRVAP